MSTISEKVENAIASLISGIMPPPKNSTENSARIICEHALGEIKKLDGLQDYLDGERKCVALMHDLNFTLTESYAETLYLKQIKEHAEHASTGKSLAEIPRGRSREAWIADMASRKIAAETAATQLSAKLQPFRRKISEIAVQTLNERAAQLMLAESRLGAAYGLTYDESPTLKKLRGLQNYLNFTAPTIVTKLLTQ
jgi:hypothetical protein